MTNGAWSKIAVVGAGAIGSYFGAALAQAGHSMTLIGRRGHIDAINRDGLLFQDQSAERRVEVSATTDIAAVSGAGLVLFCVKSLDTEQAAKQMAPHLAQGAVVVSLQNGVDNVERIRLHVRNCVIPCPGLHRRQYSSAGSGEAHRRRQDCHRAAWGARRKRREALA